MRYLATGLLVAVACAGGAAQAEGQSPRDSASVSVLYGGDTRALQQTGSEATVASSGWLWSHVGVEAEVPLGPVLLLGEFEAVRTRAQDVGTHVSSGPIGLWRTDLDAALATHLGALRGHLAVGYQLTQLPVLSAPAGAPVLAALTREGVGLKLGMQWALARPWGLEASVGVGWALGTGGAGVRGGTGWSGGLEVALVRSLTQLGPFSVAALLGGELRYDRADLTLNPAGPTRIEQKQMVALLGVRFGEVAKRPLDAPASTVEPRPPFARASLKLSFVDAVTGQPLPHVEVSFEGELYYAGAEGTVLLVDLAPRESSILGRLEGYEPVSGRVTLFPSQRSELVLPMHRRRRPPRR